MQICKLKFCQKTRFLLGPLAQGLVNILKVKFQQNLEAEVNVLLLMLVVVIKLNLGRDSEARFGQDCEV